MIRCAFLLDCCIATDKTNIFVFILVKKLPIHDARRSLFLVSHTHQQSRSTCKPHLPTPKILVKIRLFCVYVCKREYNERGIWCMFAFILIGYLVICEMLLPLCFFPFFHSICFIFDFSINFLHIHLPHNHLKISYFKHTQTHTHIY